MQNTDKLLDLVFSDMKIWEDAINDGKEKGIKKHILVNYSDPNYRDKIKEKIRNHKYHVQPPHEAQIPKDDGTMRTVYANEGQDRVLLTVINNIFFKYCKHMIHKSCMSYQSGIGCGKIDRQVVRDISAINTKNLSKLGYKIDLSKYFDSVPLQYIDEVFDAIEKQFGKSAIMDMVREYYHDDVLLDMQRNEIHKYTSLRQGCAIAAFLADAVLYDVDETMSKYNVIYYRYSDDILILGENADNAFEKISKMLEDKSLKLNPKKVETLDSNHWFTFLGFSIKGTTITLSKKRINNLQRTLEDMLFKSRKPLSLTTAMHKVYRYLYDTSITKYGYAEGILPIINCESDIEELNNYIMDAIRASNTGRKKIGGLGYNKQGSNGVIVRGKGRNVKENKMKIKNLPNYVPISYMQILFNSDRDVYNAYVNDMLCS